MVQLRVTETRPPFVESWRLASPPLAQILVNSATEAASLAARYWVSILVVESRSVDVDVCFFLGYS